MAAEPTVFGFELGKPLTLPECTFTVMPPPATYMKMYDITPAITCIEEAHKINTYGIPVRRIIFSQKDAPSIVKSWQMIALESHGDLIGLQFFTIGTQSQDLTLQQLTDKFGKPTEMGKRSVQNGFGAQFEVISASWKLPAVAVSFDAAPVRVDSGMVTIDLPEATQLRQSWVAAESTGKPL